VRRLVATLVILAVGIPLMFWAINNALMSLSRYGVKVRPMLDAGIVAGAVLLMVLLAVAAVTVVALVRSRRLLGA
jgi:hypothetical protein